MARWKLTAKHYLHAIQWGQPTEWQREEVNVQTGRAFRRSYKVPMLIDPEDKWCINNTVGFCVVATQGSELPGDIVIFDFKPTPDMEPLDDEAREMSEAERPNWINPIDGLSPQMGEDFAQQLLGALQQRANQMQIGGVPMAQAGPSPEVAELRALVQAQQKQMETLIMALSGRVTPSENPNPAQTTSDDIETYDPTKHTGDDLDPLPSIEEVEAAQRAAAGLAKAPLKVDTPRRRL